jgi:hypothetical protein
MKVNIYVTISQLLLWLLRMADIFYCWEKQFILIELAICSTTEVHKTHLLQSRNIKP